MEHKNLKSSVAFFCVKIFKIEGARKYPKKAAAIGNNKHSTFAIRCVNVKRVFFLIINIIFQFPLFLLHILFRHFYFEA